MSQPQCIHISSEQPECRQKKNKIQAIIQMILVGFHCKNGAQHEKNVHLWFFRVRIFEYPNPTANWYNWLGHGHWNFHAQFSISRWLLFDSVFSCTWKGSYSSKDSVWICFLANFHTVAFIFNIANIDDAQRE